MDASIVFTEYRKLCDLLDDIGFRRNNDIKIQDLYGLRDSAKKLIDMGGDYIVSNMTSDKNFHEVDMINKELIKIIHEIFYEIEKKDPKCQCGQCEPWLLNCDPIVVNAMKKEKCLLCNNAKKQDCKRGFAVFCEECQKKLLLATTSLEMHGPLTSCEKVGCLEVGFGGRCFKHNKFCMLCTMHTKRRDKSRELLCDVHKYILYFIKKKETKTKEELFELMNELICVAEKINTNKHQPFWYAKIYDEIGATAKELIDDKSFVKDDTKTKLLEEIVTSDSVFSFIVKRKRMY